MRISITILDNLTTHGRMAYLVHGCNQELLGAFKKFDSDNPAVFGELECIALRDYDEDRIYGSINKWYETVRTTPLAVRVPGVDYLLNNNHRAYYSRKLISRHTKFANWLDIRILAGQVYGQYE